MDLTMVLWSVDDFSKKKKNFFRNFSVKLTKDELTTGANALQKQH